MDIEKIISELTPEEKAALVAGTNFMYTNRVPRLGIPSMRMSDGPHGLRVQKEGGDNGTGDSDIATAFPPASTLASSWNPMNTYKLGTVLAEEAHHYGIHVVLGPGANLKRNPLAGRNFEYFSEDPLLSGKMAAAEIKGLQDHGTSACLKHFALNNSENYRFMGNSICDERTMKELYLKTFEIAVKEGKPDAIMCAYNQVNGVYCCQNKELLQDTLRGQWGWNGLLMTDWGACHDRKEMLKAGMDLEMPGDTKICRKWIVDGLKDGTLSEECLNDAVRNILKLVYAHAEDPIQKTDFKKHHELAKELAIDSAILLKNEGALPLKEGGRVCVIGDFFANPRYQGSGSSMIHPTELSTPKTAFENANIPFDYAPGYSQSPFAKKTPEEYRKEALKVAGPYEQVLLFAGLTDFVESEGMDRETMSLPNDQILLIDGLLHAGKKIVLILYGGSPFEIPMPEKMEAILLMMLPGQNGGEALRELLFGKHSPSGKLAETWPIQYRDVPFGEQFGKTTNEIYKENIFVGYRYYSSVRKAVRFPFGYGLSYTTFSYGDFEVQEESDHLLFSCPITNTGVYDGAEIVELYVAKKDSAFFRPIRELKGFAKVYLKPKETKTVVIRVEKNELRVYDPRASKFILENGDYEFSLCRHSLDEGKSILISLNGEILKPLQNAYGPEEFSSLTNEIFEKMSLRTIPPIQPSKPLHLDSRFSDMTSTFFGRILHSAVLSVAKSDLKKAKKMKDGPEKDNRLKSAFFLERILESNSIITMSMCAGKQCPYNFAIGFKETANGHLLKGVKAFLTPIKAPELPTEEKEK